MTNTPMETQYPDKLANKHPFHNEQKPLNQKRKNHITKGANVNAVDEEGNTPLDLTTNEEIKTLLQNTDELLEVAKSGNINEVNRLISEGASVNATDQNGNTPLHFAAEKGRAEIVKDLLDKGANLDAQNDKKETPLHFAAANGHEKIVEILLNKGANLDAQNDKEKTPLNLAADKIKNLLQSVKDANDKLLEAAKNGNIGDVENLLNEEGKAQVNTKYYFGNTPLHWAAENGKKDVVEILLNNGANVNAGAFGINLTPLHLAAQNGHEKIVEILLNKGADVNAVESLYRKTPLRSAAEKGHEGVVKVLLTKEKEIGVEILSKALYLAAEKGHEGVVKVLLTAEKINVDEYFLALHWANQKSHESVVKVLLTTEKVDVTAKGIHEKTLLHLAAEKGCTDIVNTLLRKGADVNAKDYFGKTPLHWAAANGHKEIVSALIKEEGINVYAEDYSGNTPLRLATDKGYIEIVNALTQAQKDIEDLCSAVKNGNAQKVATLLQRPSQEPLGDNPSSIGANVNVVDKDGSTPLHWAAKNGHMEIVQVLLGKRADVNIKDKDGNTPFNLATDDKIKTLLQPAEESDPVDGSSTDSKGDQGEDAGIQQKEKQEGDVQTRSDITGQDSDRGQTSTTSEEQETSVEAESVKAVAPIESAQTVGESSTDSKGDQEEDVGTQQKEKQEVNVQTRSDITGQNSDNTEPQSDNNKKEEEKTNTISAKKGTDIKAEGVKAVAPIESAQTVGESSTDSKGVQEGDAQTEEQPSSFFGSLFSILMKPFSLIGSFFGGFFSWLFGSDEPIQSSSESDQPVVLESPGNSGEHDII